MIQEMQEFFEKNHYIVIEDFLQKQLAEVARRYVEILALSAKFKLENKELTKYNDHWDGKFWEEGIKVFPDKTSYMKYGDALTDSILSLSTEQISQITKKSLYPTYSFFRLYEMGDEMKAHKDREECEVSATINLGYNYDNLDKEMYKDYYWPIFIRTKEGKDLPINLKQGDALIYAGGELDHWREPLKGLNQAQTFIHYSSKKDLFKDGRPLFGMPKVNVLYGDRLPKSD